jgi:hypothetical protein
MPWIVASTNLLSLAPAPPFVARETLRAWQEKNHPWLELSDVHRETTENIRVTVIPFYMGMRVCAQLGPLSAGLGPRFCVVFPVLLLEWGVLNLNHVPMVLL